jgi:hypothetical protein
MATVAIRLRSDLPSAISLCGHRRNPRVPRQADSVFAQRNSQGEMGCGTFGSARVFTATVKSATEISDTDKRLELIPDEIFLGSASEVTATVNQACLPLN